MENLNLIFNKLYYTNVGESLKGEEGKKAFTESLEKYNNIIFNTKFYKENDFVAKASNDVDSFILKTTYPGVLIGAGNPHGTGQSNEDINMGFSFDYVTGQPYIPGSSVKGMLRSCFKNSPGVIDEILGEGKYDIKALEKEIFDDAKDIFFDAVLYDGNECGLVMGEDYITPHKEATKNPIPIKMIKILPDVRFEFRFILKDGLLKADEKLELFSTLLQVFGVGAKTNVGYGVLVNDDLNGAIPAKRELPQRNYQSNQQDKPSQNNGQSSNNNYNNKAKNQNGNNDEMVKCPHCQAMNYRNYPDGNSRKKCYKCKEFLFPKDKR